MPLKYHNLSSDNFWGELTSKYPRSVEQFFKYFEKDYKPVNGWDPLFGNIFATEQKIDYHTIPIAMQVGIFLEFTSRYHLNNEHADFTISPKLLWRDNFYKLKNTIEEWFERQHVATIQEELNINGAKLVVDGIWGPKTEEAQKQFSDTSKFHSDED